MTSKFIGAGLAILVFVALGFGVLVLGIYSVYRSIAAFTDGAILSGSVWGAIAVVIAMVLFGSLARSARGN